MIAKSAMARFGAIVIGVSLFNLSAFAGPFPSGLVSYWNFDEPAGLALDSADGNDGTLGGSTGRVAGLIGSGAVSFNNLSGGFVNVGPGTANNFSVTSGIAVEALIVPNWSGASGDYDEIFRKDDGSNRILLSFQRDGASSTGDKPVAPNVATISLGLNIGGIYSEFDVPLDGSVGVTLADLEDGGAHHVVGTYDSATGVKAIYIDGVLLDSVILAGTITSGGAVDAVIGNVIPNGNEAFDGVIDEVAFWSRALSAEEISAHYASVQAGKSYFDAPEPATLVIFGLGLAVLGYSTRRRKTV